VKLYNIFY